MTSALRSYTPEQVENTIRGAMSGNLVAQWELFDLMEATWPRLNTNLNQLKDDVVALVEQLQPWTRKDQDATPEAERRRDLVEELIWTMAPRPGWDDKDFADTVRGCLDAVSKGISVLEIDWEPRDTDFGRVVAPARTRWIHPRYYGYPNEGEDRLMLRTDEIAARAGVLRREALPPATVGGFFDLPPDKFIVTIIKTKEGHPVASALLRVLGFWWAAINFTGEWLLNYCQLFGQPFRWANYDPNITTSDKDLLADMLENMGSAAWAMFPAGTTMELKEAAKGASDNPQMALYKMADTICDIAIKRQTLTTDVGDSGSRALGDVHENVYEKVCFNLATRVAAIVTQQFIKPICRINFGDERECPWLQAGKEDEIDPKAAAERDQILLNAGVALPKEWFYTRHGVPMPGEGDEVIEGRTAPDPMGFGAGVGRSANPEGSPSAPGSKREDDDEDEVKAIHAKDATDKLVDNTLENLTGVEARWLGGLRPHYEMLINAAQNGELTDAQFAQVLEASQRMHPELFKRIDVDALADTMERTLATAVVNGAVKGSLKRGGAQSSGRAGSKEAA